MSRVPLHAWLDRIISAHNLGYPKEHKEFWCCLHQQEPFNPERTLFIDDTPQVLSSAREYGIRWLLAISKPDSQGPVNSITGFPSIPNFSNLFTDGGDIL
jgi:putative hydrolase of the HAD superfamily